MTTELSAWNPYLQIPGAPTPAKEQAVLAAAIELCEATLIWMDDLDRISVVANDRDYDLSPPASLSSYAKVNSVEAVQYKDDGADDNQFALLDPFAARNAQRGITKSGAWKFDTAAAPSEYWVNPATMILNLYPIPTVASASGLLVTASFSPIETATVVPSFLFTLYKKAVEKGAKALLYDQRAMPWYDPKKAFSDRADFEIEMGRINLLGNTGATPQPHTINFRGDSWL